jgi:hypothetical protein
VSSCGCHTNERDYSSFFEETELSSTKIAGMGITFAMHVEPESRVMARGTMKC